MQSTTQSSNLNTKIPKKGILKNKSLSNDLSSSDNLSKSNIQSRSSSSCSSNQLLIDDAHKKMHWDEMNILATYHPIDKDYGHMKIDEAKTPFNNKFNTEDDDKEHKLDTELLETKLNLHQLPKLIQNQNEQMEIDNRVFNRNTSATSFNSDGNDDDDDDTLHRNKDFEKHRKEHYNEFKMAQLLRKSIKDEDEDEEDDSMDKNA